MVNIEFDKRVPFLALLLSFCVVSFAQNLRETFSSPNGKIEWKAEGEKNKVKAFDVMLNDIGKANNDVFKGLISGATVLLRNWETIASVGKDLVGILALLMLQSNKTGVSLKEIWNANFTSYSLKGKNALGLITASFRNLGSAAKTAGKMIKWAVMDNLPLMTCLLLYP